MKTVRHYLLLILLTAPCSSAAQDSSRVQLSPHNLTALKTEVSRRVDRDSTLVQQIIDQLFSFGELGFQEVETSRYLVNLLRHHGFEITEGVAGIPTSWIARWGSRYDGEARCFQAC